MKAELLLSREKVSWWGLELSFGDGEEIVDVFGEALDLVAQRSLRCFGAVEDILWISHVVVGETLGGAAMGFGVTTLESLKVGDCSGFSAEEALEKMESSWKSA